ncbi:hypothetical protein ACERIT_02950 [Halopenitus sp. H-Gu1]|uniref:hypothetical protein n=1 Tax=Halopenitus sp. H-Gu1 TaxID=3242697 RepID=UPI00359DAADD
MSDRHDSGPRTPPVRRYHVLDRASKILGVVLIATGLHLGGGTPAGLTVAALGVASGLLTVLINRQ